MSEITVSAACLISLARYVVFALGKLPGLKIDRPGMASIGAALMVAFRAARPEGALRLIDFHTIVLRFAMMQVAAMASTLAGNLTITGSVADLIVVERARGVAEIRFRDYFRVGLPIAALTLLFGWTWLVLVR